MIFAFGLGNGLRAFQTYLSLARSPPAGAAFYGAIRPVPYQDLLAKPDYRFFSGAHIMADLALLNGRQTERLGGILRGLRDGPLDVTVLNDPLTFPRRYELLRRLYEDGINDHNVYRVIEHRRPARWPVFVRHEIGHWHSALLWDADELGAFIETMEREGVWRGDKLIVEHNDTSDADGYYRVDSAFRIGPSIVPWRTYVARHWWLRRDQLDPADLLEPSALLAVQMAQVRDNPHEAQVMAMYERLGIQYGRMDYTMKDGRIQVWEVNSGPDLLQPKHFDPSTADRDVVALAGARLYEAFAKLDRATAG